MTTATVPLNDVCEFLDSQRIPVKESERKPGPYPYYGANGQQGWIDGFIFDEPLVLLAEDGGHFGSKSKPIAYKVTGKCWVNNHAHVLRPRSNCDIDYLHRALSHYDVSQFISGTTRKKLTKGKAAEMPILLPPLPEQKRIAGILDKADRLRRLRRYALELSDTFLQSVFLEMFGDPVTNPMDWPIRELGSICERVIDCPHSTPKYADGKTPYPCVRSSDIQKGYFDLSSTKYVDRKDYLKRVERTVPQPGDVVYCREGARFGNAARIPVDTNACLGQRTMLFRVDQKQTTPEFIWGYLESNSTYSEAQRLAGGSASPHVNVGDIKNFRVPVAPRDMQRKFTSVVKKQDGLRLQQIEAIRQANHLFDTLLHREFRAEA